MNMLKLFLYLSLLISLVGCASALNIRNAENYDMAARNAAEQGDWKTAQMYYSRAWGNAKMGGADTRDISRLRYEYGRASGVVCDWEEAELALNESYELDRQSKGPYWMPLVELERMSIAKGDVQNALKYFEKLMPILKEIQAETKDPLGYADLLDEYVLVLEKNGKEDVTGNSRNQAKKIRDAFPDSKAHTEITPYGKYCK